MNDKREPGQPLAYRRDAVIVNLMRLANLDKHTARAIVDAAFGAQPEPTAERVPLTRRQVQQIVIDVCDQIYPQDGVSYSEADSLFYGPFVTAVEAAHGIKP